MNEVGKRLHDLRVERGMSQEELAALIEPATTKMTISRFERGQRKITDGWLTKLARALNVTVKQIVGEEDFHEISLPWLETEMKRQSKTRKELASLLGIPASGVTDIFQGNRRLSVDEMKTINAWISKGAGAVPASGVAPVGIAEAKSYALFRMEESEGGFKQVGPVGKASPLSSDFEGFAVLYDGYDASPRYEAGDTLFVDTSRPARKADFVYVAWTDGTVSVRRLINRTSDGYEFETIDSGKKLKSEADVVASIHVIKGVLSA